MELHSRVSKASMLIFALIALSSLAPAKSVDDIVVLNNGDRMTGEIKSLDHGELRFKSSYMLDPVALDWPRVTRLESKDNYIVVLTSGRVLTARIQLDATAGASERSFVYVYGNRFGWCEASRSDNNPACGPNLLEPVEWLDRLRFQLH
jgi:hypothetical protein